MSYILSSVSCYLPFSSDIDTMMKDIDAVYHKLLWTAPELLQKPRDHRPRYGTKEGDVYSFGVIAREVLYRAPPYFVDTEKARGKWLLNNIYIVKYHIVKALSDASDNLEAVLKELLAMS